MREAGFSLIELMVAILIGLFITLGLSQVFLSMYSTSQSQTTLSQFQNNQKTSIVLLSNTVQLGGYFAAPPTSINYAATALPAVTNPGDSSTFVAGAGIVGTTGTGSPQQDTLNIYYQTSGSDNVFNCQGGTATSTSPTPTYTTFINSFAINANNQLTCTVSKNGGTPNTALVLANNIQNMTITYAVDTTGGTADTTNAYMTAAQVTTSSMWNNVRAVQITLNFCTSNVMNPASTSCASVTPWVQTINLMSKS